MRIDGVFCPRWIELGDLLLADLGDGDYTSSDSESSKFSFYVNIPKPFLNISRCDVTLISRCDVACNLGDFLSPNLIVPYEGNDASPFLFLVFDYSCSA